jgi:hypothetical protein
MSQVQQPARKKGHEKNHFQGDTGPALEWLIILRTLTRIFLSNNIVTSTGLNKLPICPISVANASETPSPVTALVAQKIMSCRRAKATA